MRRQVPRWDSCSHKSLSIVSCLQEKNSCASREANTELLVCILDQVIGSSEAQIYRGQELDYCRMAARCRTHAAAVWSSRQAKTTAAPAGVTPLHLLQPLLDLLLLEA